MEKSDEKRIDQSIYQFLKKKCGEAAELFRMKINLVSLHVANVVSFSERDKTRVTLFCPAQHVDKHGVAQHCPSFVTIVLGDGGYRGTGYVMARQLSKLYPLHTH